MTVCRFESCLRFMAKWRNWYTRVHAKDLLIQNQQTLTMPHDTLPSGPAGRRPPEMTLLLLSVASVLALAIALVADIIRRRRACVSFNDIQLI